MLRFRSVSKVLLTGLLFTLLLLMPACAGEEAAIQLPETEAGGILAAALAEAGETDRYVFVHTGADW